MSSMKNTIIVFALVILTLAGSVYAQDTDDVVLVESSLKPGDMAPMFVLPDAQGNMIMLADLLEDGPVLVFFYRGAWCPFCTTAHAKMSAALPKFREQGVTVVAISPQIQKYTAETVGKNNIEYLTLSDEGVKIAKEFGLDFEIEEELQKIYKGKYNLDLAEYNGEGGWQLPVPGYYLINTDGTIAWAYANPDYKVRPEPEQILAAIKEMKMEN